MNDIQTFVVQESYYDRNARDLINIINANYKEAKKAHISRMDIKWGVWSGAMNRVTRKNQREGKYKNLQTPFDYWQLMSQLLELHFKAHVGWAILYKGKIKRQLRLIKKFREECF